MQNVVVQNIKCEAGVLSLDTCVMHERLKTPGLKYV